MPKGKYISQAPKRISPEVFLEQFEIYAFETKDNPFLVHDFVGKDGDEVHRKKERCLTIEGFENFLEKKFGMSTIQQYLENREGRYPEYLSTLRTIRRQIREDQISGGMAGVYNAGLTARINGLSENVETKGDSVKVLNIDPL